MLWFSLPPPPPPTKDKRWGEGAEGGEGGLPREEVGEGAVLAPRSSNGGFPEVEGGGRKTGLGWDPFVEKHSDAQRGRREAGPRPRQPQAS